MPPANRYKLEFVVFICGCCSMVLELVGSRVISPYFGTGLYSWTSLIGVILGSLSLGYFLGGKLADKHHQLSTLSLIIFSSGLLIALSALFKNPLLNFLSTSPFLNKEINCLLSITILFASPSILLGMVSPYTVKIKLNHLKYSGKIIGNLYAISTLGSIAGTFLSGFVLIPLLGNTLLLYLLSFTLIVLSWLTNPKISLILMETISFFLIFTLSQQVKLFQNDFIADIDTPYQRVIVNERLDSKNRVIRYMTNNLHLSQSSIYKNDPDIPMAPYIQSFQLIDYLPFDPVKTLMIGGAGLTYPRIFATKHPTSTMDVIEIDHTMTDIAKKYFYYKNNSQINIIHQDARLFVKSTSEQYDVIFLDAFTDFNPPPQLTTIEFIKDLNRILSDQGIIVINFISATSGPKSELLSYQLNTLRQVFPNLDVFVLNKQQSPDQLQNLILFASKQKVTLKTITDLNLKDLLSQKLSITNLQDERILTDDHNPVEYLTRYY